MTDWCWQKFDRLVTYHRIHSRPLLLRIFVFKNLFHRATTNKHTGQLLEGGGKCIVSTQNFGWAMAHQAHRAAPPWSHCCSQCLSGPYGQSLWSRMVTQNDYSSLDLASGQTIWLYLSAKNVFSWHGWRRGSVVRTSVFGWRSFPDLWLTCDHFVGKVSAMGQLTRPTQPSVPSGK